MTCALEFAPDVVPIPEVRDSKQLTSRARARLSAAIREQALDLAIGAASVAEIDRLNIRMATALAMRRALQRLKRVDHVLLDGPMLPGLEQLAPVTPLIGGDRRSYSIAAASIVAKQLRDELLTRLARRHPAYGWDRNFGYLTAEHLAALEQFGISAHHRRSFGPVRTILERAA